jgi:hypothetical protein
MSVQQMLLSMDSRELVEWEIFHAKIEPVGGTRLDWLVAMLAHMLALVNGNKDSKLTDYLLFPVKPEAEKPKAKPQNLLRAKIMTTFRGYEASRAARRKGNQRAG